MGRVRSLWVVAIALQGCVPSDNFQFLDRVRCNDDSDCAATEVCHPIAIPPGQFDAGAAVASQCLEACTTQWTDSIVSAYWGGRLDVCVAIDDGGTVDIQDPVDSRGYMVHTCTESMPGWPCVYIESTFPDGIKIYAPLP